jgi:transposase
MVKSKVVKSKFAKRYPKEFRQMVELYRAGNTLTNLSQRFGPTPWAISRWVKQADRDEGRGDGGLTTAEREELVRLRRENKRLQMEREILSAWFAQETAPPIRQRQSSVPSNCMHPARVRHCTSTTRICAISSAKRSLVRQMRNSAALIGGNRTQSGNQA